MITALYLSPAGSTAKLAQTVAAAIAEAMGTHVKEMNITAPAARIAEISFGPEDIVIVASPTYAGRIPNKIMPFFQDKVKGNGAKCVALVNYGNRNYDNSLREMYQLMLANGFQIVGAGAFVSRHVFSDVMAPGRPNADDLAEAASLGKAVAQKLLEKPVEEQTIVIEGEVGPYYTPLKEDGTRAVFLKAKPKTRDDLCAACVYCEDTSLCVHACPMGSINPENPAEVTGICIKCHACIHACPAKARYFDDAELAGHIRMLEQNYASVLRPNEVFV